MKAGISVMNRRSLMQAGAAAALAGALPARLARAAGAPIPLGTLTPLTGAGGPYGPSMRKAMEWVAGEVNKAGGVLGRELKLYSEDGETNPDAAVRAARKLIDVDKVAAVMGTWASAVTTAVAPLCWESKTFLTTVSGSDTITKLPHHGYLVRTQPNTVLQMTGLARFVGGLGAKTLFVMSVQAPFAAPTHRILGEELPKHGCKLAGTLTYDKDKASYRSEVDEALRAKPDMIYLNGYTPDTIVLLKDLYKSGYDGKRIAQAYAVNAKLLASLPHEVTDGIYTIAPSPDVGSASYNRLAKVLGTQDLDPYSCQCHDHVSLVALAIAKAGEASGTAIRDNIRKISQGSGTKVDSAVEGLKLLAAGKEINYEGVSGPCDFTDIGDIRDTKFRYEQAENGKFKLVKIA